MKVLIICTEKLPNPPIKGGAIQTYIAGAIPILSKNHQITILGTNDPKLPHEETIDGVHYVRVPGKLLETYRKGVATYVRENRFDLIHIFNRPRLVSAVHDVAPNSRIILSMHNDMFKKEKIEQEEAKKAINCLDKIITISNYIGEEIVKFYPEAKSKIQTIYSGVDLKRFVPVFTEMGQKLGNSIRKEHNLESKKIILFAGRLSANKGSDVLIHAIHELAKNHPDIALVVIGGRGFSDNRMSDYIAYLRAITYRFPVPVITPGFVNPGQIQNWFAAADIFVCPSQWEEPLARVHYEAMAAGLPIITTARGGNPEVIEVNKNGVIVEKPEDPMEFVKHLTKLLSNPSLCREMGQYGRRFVERKHSWHRVVSDISQVWDEIRTRIENNTATANISLINEEKQNLNENKSEQTLQITEEEVQGHEKKLNDSLEESTEVEDDQTVQDKMKKDKEKNGKGKKDKGQKEKKEQYSRNKKKLPYSPFRKTRSKNLGLVKIKINIFN
ncbi:lipopolysaccharide N-acetylglucosaminyltransferase [Salipaludibacillus neizhouensis]|uniref:Lipopolysaccharide N-acetylglucosaminyltransferase n=1 Tax=Salipaludibacillus neizhouensis TaxID=885475 RepID=A0A3A9K5F9_9BACI|nr:glycosyltransferase family 4 protein [Salipaludibacillus neizhouensis]RKL65692.1 lipopolysaccharide N-acetylglucosaminyltransferase [Salipaludibacillus neizhouensis]